MLLYIYRERAHYVGIVADHRGEWAATLPRAPPHGKPAPLLADEARSAPANCQNKRPDKTSLQLVFESTCL